MGSGVMHHIPTVSYRYTTWVELDFKPWQL